MAGFDSESLAAALNGSRQGLKTAMILSYNQGGTDMLDSIIDAFEMTGIMGGALSPAEMLAVLHNIAKERAGD